MSDNHTMIGGNAYGSVVTGDHGTAHTTHTVVHQTAVEPRPWVFVSSESPDAAVVDRIVDALRGAGVAVWSAADPLVAAGAWPPDVATAISGSRAFVACFSPRYVDAAAWHINPELRQAIGLQQARAGARWLVPVQLEPVDVRGLPAGGVAALADITGIDFSDDWTSAVENLVALLGR